jgi:hypothetical protein
MKASSRGSGAVSVADGAFCPGLHESPRIRLLARRSQNPARAGLTMEVVFSIPHGNPVEPLAARCSTYRVTVLADVPERVEFQKGKGVSGG